MTDTSEQAASAEIVTDIATLARKLAKKEPYKSATGHDALLLLATHLDEMVASDPVGPHSAVRVADRNRKDQ